MPTYVRDDATDLRVIDRWDDGVGWLVAPEEDAQRASHAVLGDDGGIWLFDPLDAPGVDDLVADLGEVAGVAVLSNYHARDAGAIARRHDVAVHLPASMTRVEERVDAPIERFSGTLADSGFRVRTRAPLPGWRESVAYRPSDGTLYAPDVLGTAPPYRVGDERLGVYLFRRPAPPRESFEGLDVARILVGHGTGVFERPDEALEDALAGARERFPRALLENGASQLRALTGAVRE
ncbi:hypothetical protein M0R88_03890 [Halorussus gelatinilyticus]|uniref:Uncharacterized protein n=1 Tax=Halorussus gelatinilyticus TaxID=2937524 RepID=A0A8U0IJN1_9EURY|nr:hypothetical protein [Halorussus gelatinilyticus]UPW01253.1 hypothetical protein M0R88_03890 [Halorussus gelatinilyticus]